MMPTMVESIIILTESQPNDARKSIINRMRRLEKMREIHQRAAHVVPSASSSFDNALMVRKT